MNERHLNRHTMSWKQSVHCVVYPGVITHESLVCSNNSADNTNRILPFLYFWLLSTVSLTFTEIHLIIISRGSAGCKFKKKNGVLWLKRGLCVGGLFWSLLYPNEVCVAMFILMISSWPYVNHSSDPNQGNRMIVNVGNVTMQRNKEEQHVRKLVNLEYFPWYEWHLDKSRLLWLVSCVAGGISYSERGWQKT